MGINKIIYTYIYTYVYIHTHTVYLAEAWYICMNVEQYTFISIYIL